MKIKIKRCCLFISLTLLVLSKAIAQNDCHSLIESIILERKQTTIPTPTELTLINHPIQHLHFKISTEVSNTIYANSKKDFMTSIKQPILGYDLQKLLKLLETEHFIEMIKNHPKKLQEMLEQLKVIRKKANTLRSLLMVFDSHHESPESFENFTKTLGKLNDALDFQAFELLPKYAQKTKKSFHLSDIKEELDDFSPSPFNDTKEYLEELKFFILKMLTKKEIPTKDFHEVRKKLKHFMTIFLCTSNYENDSEVKISYNFLNELNDHLGLLRDINLKNEIQSKNNKEKVELADTIIFPENYKDDILIFLNGLELINKTN